MRARKMPSSAYSKQHSLILGTSCLARKALHSAVALRVTVFVLPEVLCSRRSSKNWLAFDLYTGDMDSVIFLKWIHNERSGIGIIRYAKL